MDPNSALMPEPTFPAQIIAVINGPNALTIAIPIREGSQETAPKFSKEGRDCFVKTTPTIKPVSVMSESDFNPIS
jgi:hypothetical protein